MNRVLQPFAHTRTQTSWPYLLAVAAIIAVALWCVVGMPADPAQGGVRQA